MCVCVPLFIPIHFVISAPSSTFSVLCDLTPAVQQSFNEWSTWETRNGEQEKDFIVLFFSFYLGSTTCAVLRDAKPRPSAEARIWLWLALQSHGRRKKTKWCINKRRHTPTLENALTLHTSSLFTIFHTKLKKRQMSVLHGVLPWNTQSFHYSLSSPLLASCYSHSLISLRACVCLVASLHVLERMCVWTMGVLYVYL